jgi:hypothetical protein
MKRSPRILSVIITYLSAVTLIVPVGVLAQQPAQPVGSSQRPMGDLGGSLQPTMNIQHIAAGKAFAVLFLQGSTSQDQIICGQYLTDYGDSLTRGQTYKKYVYFSKKDSYSSNILDCNDLGHIYNSRIWSLYEPFLSLDSHEGAVAVLMIILKDSNGNYEDKGYIDFPDAQEPAVSNKFDKFDAYYLCGPQYWENNKQIDEPLDPFIGVLSSIGNRIFGGPRCVQ